ncbi:hypothetical protein Ctob_015928, partial [Chrysochromulina tobinii]
TGSTPLHLAAASSSSVAVVQALLAANPEAAKATTEGGETPADCALDAEVKAFFASGQAAADKAAADKAAAEELRRRATALGLLQVLTTADIADDATLKKSMAFCDEQGVTNVSDMVEYNLVDDFVRHLGLKTVPGLKLRGMLQTPTSGLAAQLSDPLASPSSSSNKPSPESVAQQAAADKAVVEKASSSSPSLQKAGADAVQAVLASANGVDWPHCRLQVRGPGGVGKSSTIDAMSGKEFTSTSVSTAGARLTTCEVERRSLEVASKGRPLKVYNLADGETEHARAVAVAAQGRITEAAKQASEAEKATGSEGRRSMLADEAPQRGAGMAVVDAAETTPVWDQSSPKRTPLIQGLSSHAPLQLKAAAEEKQRQAAEEKQKQAAELAAAAGKLVIKGAELPRLVLHIQDSGGQDVFLSVLDLLHAPKASVSMLVFSLPDLQNPVLRDNSIAQLRVQLDSFAVHASKSPLLLVGTRKDEAMAAGGGGDAALARLSEELRKALTDARLAKVRYHGDLCFFPIENSKGFAGDETIRELVGAIEGAAMELDSMKQRVPAGWLAVYDALALEMSATPTRQHLSLAEVTAIASRFGLPHDPARVPLEREVQMMLSYFHSLGAVCWYDLPEVPEVRELVVLDPQWIIDAVSMIICNFDDPAHLKPCHALAARHVTKEWKALRNGGVLSRVLLEYLWREDRFEAHKAELLKLMEHFGLVVPIRRKEQQTYIVPALLALSEGANQPTTPTDAPLATLHFALAGQAPPDTAPVWAPEDFLPDSGGFLPDGAFFELCGAAVGWSYHTARGFTPALGSGFAHVKFGRHELLLSRSDGAPYITVAILNAGRDRSPSAWSPAIDRLRLLVDGISSRFVNLRCTCLLPLSSVDEAEKRHVERGALLAADIDGSQVYYVVGRQQLTTRELASRLSAYLPPLKPPDHYGAFLSYSHVPAFDMPFTEKLADCLGAQSPLVTTFLDKRTASRGTDLDVVCLLAMANSRVIVPIVTWNALRRMTSLTDKSGLDYLLLEWSFALLQHEHGAAVLPIFIGASDADGSADPSTDLFKARPPLARADGWGNALDDAGRVQPDERSVWERVPDVVVDSVARSLESFYTKHELVPPPAIRTRTAREVVMRLSKIWGEATSSSHSGAAGYAGPVASQAARNPGMRTHELLGLVDGHWGLPEAVAQSVSKAVRDAELREPPKLLGQRKPAPPANEGETGRAIEAALLEKMLADLKDLKDGQKDLKDGQKDLKDGQKEVMGQLAQIRLTQDKAIEMLSAHSTMLTTLLLGTQAAPKLVLFLPVAQVTGKGISWLKKALSPKDWLNHRVRIFFVDPLTYTVAKTHPNDKGEAEGFELTFPKEWVVKAMPYIKLGLTVLKVAAAAGKLTGLPIPDLGSMAGEWIDSQLSALDGFKEEAITKMGAMTKDEATARELLGAVDAKCQELLGEKVQELKLVDGEPLKKKLEGCLEMSARELDALLSEKYHDWKGQCGLELAVHTPSGKCEWVLPKDKKAFEANGMRMVSS